MIKKWESVADNLTHHLCVGGRKSDNDRIHLVTDSIEDLPTMIAYLRLAGYPTSFFIWDGSGWRIIQKEEEFIEKAKAQQARRLCP